MNAKDWDVKVILQKDNTFIEHVLNSKQDVDEEDRMVKMLDGIDEMSEETERKELLLGEAEIIINKLTKESQRVLFSFINNKGFQLMADDLGVSVSTAWKKWQKVQKEIEEIKNGRERETI